MSGKRNLKVEVDTPVVEMIASEDLDDGDDEYGGEVLGDDDDWGTELVLPSPKADSKRQEHLSLFGDRLDIFYALLAVADLRFYELDAQTQQKLIKNLKVETFHGGDIIIKEGDEANAFYILLATQELSTDAEVEVYKTLEDGSRKVLTSLSRGHYFGEKTFVSNNPQPRNASIRVPTSCKVGVEIGIVTSEYYADWDHFRQFLVMKDVPLIKSLPRNEQLEMYSKLIRREYNSNEFIITEGDPGEDFYIILEGVVNVQDKMHGVLVNLQAGHCFGEMALLSDEPRVASVVAVSKVVCLCLSKVAFRAALSAEKFSAIVTDVMEQRRVTRLKRDREREKLTSAMSRKGSVASLAGDGDGEFPELGSQLWVKGADSGGSMLQRGSCKSTYSSGCEVTFSSKLVIKKIGQTKYINKYRVVKEIGKGSFGSVYMVVNEQNNEPCAMKAVNRSTGWNRNKVDIMSEIEIMKHLNHKNIVALKGVIDDLSAQKMFIVQELLGGGSLMNEEMTASGNNNAPIPFSNDQSRKYFRDMVKAVHYLHSLGIIHRDIKPQNILLTEDGQCKLSDFGSAISVHAKSKKKLPVAGTPAFMATELFLDPTPEVQKAPAIDIFALGATLYCMVIGKVPWMAKNEIDLGAQITRFEVTFPVECHLDPHLKVLLLRMMEKDPIKRISLDDIISNDWVTCESSEPMYDDFERIPPRCPLFRQASKVLMNSRSCSSGSSDTSPYSLNSQASLSSGMSGVIFPSGSTKSTVSPVSGLGSPNSAELLTGKVKSRSLYYPTLQSRSHHYDDEDNEMDFSHLLARDLDRLQERSMGNSRSNSIARLVPSLSGNGLRLLSPEHDDMMGSQLSLSSSDLSGGLGPAVIYYGVDDILDLATMFSPAVSNAHSRTASGVPTMHSISEDFCAADDDDYNSIGIDIDAKLARSFSDGGFGSVKSTDSYDNRTSSGDVPTRRQLPPKQPSLKRTGGFEIVPTELTMTSTGEKISKGIVIETPASQSPKLGRGSLYSTSTKNGKSMRSLSSRTGSMERIVSVRKKTAEASYNVSAGGRPNENIKAEDNEEDDHANDDISQSVASTDDNIWNSSGSGYDSATSNNWNEVASQPGESGSDTMSPTGGNKGTFFSSKFEGIREESCDELDQNSDNDSDSDDDVLVEGDMLDISEVGLDSMFDMAPVSAPQSQTDKEGVDGLCWQPLSDIEVGGAEKLRSKLQQCGMYCGTECMSDTLGVRCGSALDKGGRLYMEDKVFAHTSLADVIQPANEWQVWNDSGSVAGTGVRMSLQNPESIGCFGVLDGHNGAYVVDQLEAALPRLLLQVLLGEVTRYFHKHYTKVENKMIRVDTGESIFSSSSGMASPMLSIRSVHSNGNSTPNNSGGETPRTPRTPGGVSKNPKKFGFKKMFTFAASHIQPKPKAKHKTVIIGDGTSGMFLIPASYVHDARADVEPNRDSFFKQCLLDCCALADREIVEYDFARQEKLLQIGRDGFKNNGAGGSIVNTHFAGCVGTVVVIVNTSDGLDIKYRFPGVKHNGCSSSGNTDAMPSADPRNNHATTCASVSLHRKMFLANVGDCRTVVSDAGVATQLTEDHKPDLPEEKKRVEAAGGFVHKGRVNGVLAVSRSFGDIMYRNYTPPVPGESAHLSATAYAQSEIITQNPSTAEECEPDGLWNPSTQPVIAKPDIYEYTITESSEFIIMASDGLWDVIKSQEAVNFVRRQLYEHSTIARAAQELLAKAIERGSSDNISVQIVCLNQIGFSTGGEGAKCMPLVGGGGGVGGTGTGHTVKNPNKLRRERTGPQCTTQ